MSNPKRIATRSKAKIVIRLMPSGRVQVTGPLAKDRLCIEMLREAERLIRTFQADIAKQVVTPSPPNFSPAGFGQFSDSEKTASVRRLKRACFSCFRGCA